MQQGGWLLHPNLISGHSQAIFSRAFRLNEYHFSILIRYPQYETLGQDGSNLSLAEIDDGDHLSANQIPDVIVISDSSRGSKYSDVGSEIDIKYPCRYMCIRQRSNGLDCSSPHVDIPEVLDAGHGESWLASAARFATIVAKATSSPEWLVRNCCQRWELLSMRSRR